MSAGLSSFQVSPSGRVKKRHGSDGPAGGDRCSGTSGPYLKIPYKLVFISICHIFYYSSHALDPGM